MNRTRRINLWTILTLVLLASLVLPWTAFAAVWTDKLDYSPGETVTILGDNSDGAGYIPGETVHVDVVGPNGYTAMCDGVAADTSNADWSCQVTLWDSDLAVGTYTYTATGLISGVEEQGTFTDGNPQVEAQAPEGIFCSGQETEIFVPGETVCAFAYGLGSSVDATIEWWGPHTGPNGPATLTTTFEDVSGNVAQQLQLDEDTYPEQLGPWTIKLYVNGIEKADNTFKVIPAVTIDRPIDYALYPITDLVEVDFSWTDPGELDSFDCTVDWGDGMGVGVPYDCTSPQTDVTHNYSDVGAGLYPITITVKDDHGGIGTASIVVVVYDPDAGFVTGGGWIDSPAGAYRQTTLTGRATFGFVSKYQNGADVPVGETEFQFHVADFNFHSDSYEWLVVNQSGTNAQYKGVGALNGIGGYGFMLWGTDGDVDTFRIKIWEDEDKVIYDNGFDQPIASGTIIVQTGKK